MKFNPEQLASIDEARALAALVDSHKIGTGIAPVDETNDYHNAKSGVYMDPWVDPDGNTPEPRNGDSRPFMLRFNPTPEGFQPGGFNVGLLRSVAERHTVEGNPLNWGYALGRLELEYEQQVAAFNQSQNS